MVANVSSVEKTFLNKRAGPVVRILTSLELVLNPKAVKVSIAPVIVSGVGNI